MPDQSRRRQFFYRAFATVFSALFMFSVLEVAVRRMALPDPELIEYMDRVVEKPAELTYYATRPSDFRQFGWDSKQDIYFPSEEALDETPAAPLVLIVGDSVTRGKDVAEDDAYPSVLFRMLEEEREIRLINAAVNGYGVDQMILKLEQSIETYRPDVVVFAYIPHDLWRSGRNINWGLTKPVLKDIRVDSWRVIASPDMQPYYQSYMDADRGYYRTFWYLRHVSENMPYYFPGLYESYYEALFNAIRMRLVSLAERYGLEVLVVRLPSTWPGSPIGALDDLAKVAFDEPSPHPDYTFHDLDDCVRSLANESGIDFEESYRWHPQRIGHEIYAKCLLNPLRHSIEICSDGSCEKDQ